MGKLGIIDWGIGGISIYRLILERIGNIPVSYFSDTGVTPYGKMSRSELVDRLDNVIRFLSSRGVTHVVIGCNAASTAIHDLSAHDAIVEGVIGPAVAVTARQKPNSLGLIGGRRTVVSGVYRRAFATHGISVRQRIAQPLSGLIESGDVGSDKLRAEAKRILAPIRNCSHILLACTHYPAITPILRDLVSKSTQFIDPAEELVGLVDRWDLPKGGNSEFMTSGNVGSMVRAAKTAFGVSITNVSKTSV